MGGAALEPLVLLVPSLAAGTEIPRRLASAGRAWAGVYALRLLDLARTLAEPALLGSGQKGWDAGMGAVLAARLLDEVPLALDPDLPRPPVARLLARTLDALRQAGVGNVRLRELQEAASQGDDKNRLGALAAIYERYLLEVQGRFADPATILRTAALKVKGSWLEGARIFILDDLELSLMEQEFLLSVAAAHEVRRMPRSSPPALRAQAFSTWAEEKGIASLPWSKTPFSSAAPGPPAEGIDRLRSRLFEPPSGEAASTDDSVWLVTAPGEAQEVRALTRRLLREAERGVLFEEMGIALARPEEYAPLVSDLLTRLGVPFRLHPSLPLKTGRAARSLLLLLRCRGLARTAVLEFLTFAPVRFRALLEEGAAVLTAQWEEASRDAGITAGIHRWRVGLNAYSDAKGREAQADENPGRREAALRRADSSKTLLQLVEALHETLEELRGEHPWPRWSAMLAAAFDSWVGPERDHEAVAEVLRDLAGLESVSPKATLEEVENVLEARFEWERVPIEPPARGGIHVGAFDAIAGLSFRVLAIPGLVEGGYPGPLRPDPFLLDSERDALQKPPSAAGVVRAQLSLFESLEPLLLPTSQGRLLEQRRLFHRALCQAEERLILSYPRADPRTGRERLPSLFFVASASALHGRALDVGALSALVDEDDPRSLPPSQALDRVERDRCRCLAGGQEAAREVAQGSVFFRHSLLMGASRWARAISAYDGFVQLSPELQERLDPVASGRRLSATRLHSWADCGFRFLLDAVLHVDPVEEPEERNGLNPLERGRIFHEVAERFLRERKTLGELPVRLTQENVERLTALAEEALQELVAGTPPRHRLLWEMARDRLIDLLQRWLARETMSARGTPAHFEVGFGVPKDPASSEPHSPEPLAVELGDGRTLLVSGKIDRIDVKSDGTLVVRDYKAGRAPKDDVAAGFFRGGRQLQIPFYVRAALALFPGKVVSEAFLDYVDGGRMVSFDPTRVIGDEFLGLLRRIIDAMGKGLFLQDAAACRYCDFTRACGPAPLIALRQARKRTDLRAAAVFRLKEAP